jgi:hypothetical protein
MVSLEIGLKVKRMVACLDFSFELSIGECVVDKPVKSINLENIEKRVQY